jgi:hypothetical protein
MRNDHSGQVRFKLSRRILPAMITAATPVPLSEAKVHLSELVMRIRRQHERVALLLR